MDGAVTIARHTFRTHDPEPAHDVLARTYGRHRYQISGDSEGFRFALRAASAGPITSDAMRHSMNLRADAEPLFQPTVGSVRGGSVAVERGREEVSVGPGDVVLYPYGEGFHIRWTRFDQRLVRVRFETVAALAEQATGTDARRFRFLGMRALSPGMAGYWRSVATLVDRTLAGAASTRVPALLLGELENTVAAAMLSAFPNTTLTVAHPMPVGHVGPAALRRAVAYIDAHAGEALTAGDVASSVGVRPRALQGAFTRDRDTTPLGYLRQVRLENAHRDLQIADPATGATVTEIAREWGFPNADRFAAAYRRAYRVAPQRTLRAT